MSTNLTKAELVSLVAKDTQMTKAASERILNSMIANIQEALVKGKTIQLIGFGSFSTTQRAARTGRNPQTGKKINIPAKTVPKFKPGKNLREAVNSPKKKGKKKKK